MKKLRLLKGIAALVAIVAGTSLSIARVGEQTRQPASEGIDRQSLPVACQQFLSVPADAKSELLPWQQRLSLAACRQEVTLPAVTSPQQVGALVASLESAAKPSIEMYRDAIANGPDQIRILGAYGMGMTYQNIMVRARRAIADNSMGGTTYGTTAFQRTQTLRLALEPLLLPDREGALAAYDEVARLADQSPKAATANSVVIYAVKDAANQARLLR